MIRILMNVLHNIQKQHFSFKRTVAEMTELKKVETRKDLQLSASHCLVYCFLFKRFEEMRRESNS